jgi:hypothetical protein
MAAFGTPLEQQVAEAMGVHGDLVAAAEAIGMTAPRVRAHLRELAARAARRGWSPAHDMSKTVPEGFAVKGVSTMYDADGNVRGQWVKSSRDPEHRLEALFAAVASIAEPFRGASDPVPAPAAADEDLLCIYPFGDPHFGMYAWAQEAGESFDLNIAERELVAAVDHLVALAPPAREAIIMSLGDMFHSDGNSAQTTAGTRVDVDSRWGKVLTVVIRAMRRCIDLALLKHEIVHVICASGNHDDMTSLVLAVCLSQYYEREPRVQVDTSPAKFYWHRFGKCLIGVHHGDTAKARDLPAIMACDRQKDWGETDHRQFYCGHIHHETVKEYPGVIVESFRTLAPKDAWHAAAGYRSGRDLRLDIWHREHGKIQRHIVGIRQVQQMTRR